jgi:outer membrane protein OmpA-like peptidoglycan-associated protein
MNLPVWRCAAILIVLCAATLTAQQERVNLGSGINSQYSELQPVVTSDGQIMFFTRKGHPQNVGIATRADDEDIWYTVRRSDGSWSDAIHLDGPLNTAGYDGVRAVNKDVTRLYLQNQYRPDGSRGKGFSVSERGADGSWAFPTALSIENYYNDTTVATMAMSNDEKVMMLSLKRKDSKGGHDVYVAFRTGPYEFSEPKRVDALSTEGDEIAPFIGFDDCTIYLPTTGWGAENGTHDVFMTHRLDATWMNWSEPARLPEPINTPSADFYFNLTADADTVYLSSWHESSTRGFGKSDIWKVALPKKHRPGTFIASGEPISPQGATGPATGALLRLDNLYFDVSKSSIKNESHEVLSDLLALLNRYPTMRIEIQGHTDSDGSEQDNLSLSNGRASAVMKYLITKGIPARRLTSVGFGESIPIAPNTNAEGKRLNRRVMIRILGYDYQP